MRKKSSTFMIVIFIITFGTVVYYSKSDIYSRHKKFYNNTINSEVRQITHGRGIKVYYSKNDLFYTSFCQNSNELENLVKVGDVIKKQNSDLQIYRSNGSDELVKVFSTKVIPPAESYFSYFFSN